MKHPLKRTNRLYGVKITQAEVDKAKAEFFKRGGKITRLPYNQSLEMFDRYFNTNNGEVFIDNL